jgi:hypothetical protein
VLSTTELFQEVSLVTIYESHNKTKLYKKRTRHFYAREHRDAMTSLNLDFSVLDRPVRKEADELTST